jgi:uncharacterized membrane protein
MEGHGLGRAERAQERGPNTPELEQLKAEDLEQALSPPVEVVAGPAAEVEQPSTVRVERLIGVTLLAGVLTSTLIVLSGGLVYVWRHSHLAVHYRVFRGEPSDLRHLSGILHDVKALTGRGIIQLGLILLVCLQVLRVVLTGVLFLTVRDRLYVLLSAIVLALLAYGLVVESIVRH